MISGSNYVRVEANAVMPMAEGASQEENQGFQVSGNYVNWTTAGVTGSGWDAVISMPYSPFTGMTAKWAEGDPADENDILYIINRDKNLNTVFYAWGNSTKDYERFEFLYAATQTYGWTSQNGCIGDKLA